MKKNITGYTLLLFQIIAHVSLIWLLFNLTWTTAAVVLFMYFLTGCLGISVTFHRLLSHRSWDAPAWWYYVGSVLGTLALVGSPLAWTNNHRAHHRYADTEKDPHSPVFMPWWKVQWFSMLTSSKTFRYVISDINKFQTFLHRYYFLIHSIILFFLLIGFGPYITVVVYLAPAAFTWNMAGLINTINHTYGYRTYIRKDTSTNNIFTGIFVFGEGWHNNHHKSPGNSKFGEKWWEFDIGNICINIISKFKINIQKR